MTKDTSITPKAEGEATQEEKQAPAQTTEMEQPVHVRPRGRVKVPPVWQWLIVIIVLGALTVIVASSLTGYWIRTVSLSLSPTATPVQMTTLNIQRAAPYAGLEMNVISAQYATSFNDDNIHPGRGIVRLNMQVTNRGGSRSKVIYYDSARLIAPSTSPIVPTNLTLSTGPQPGKSESGWLDFSVSQPVQLDKLTLQMGNTTIKESLVKIPFKGSFDSRRYTDKTVRQALSFNYIFTKKFINYSLNYHLNSVEVRYAFQGTQCKEGQQFYIFDFSVDNPNGGEVTPGPAYTYARLAISGYNQYPLASTLPETIKGNARGVKGQIVFSGPANMHALDLVFLKQYLSVQYSYGVHV